MRRRVMNPFGMPTLVGKVKAPPPKKPLPEPPKVALADIIKQGEWVPPLPSPRCGWWCEYIANGWRPNKALRSLGYLDAAKWFGVYIWEFKEVLVPLMRQPRARVAVPRSQIVGPGG